MDGFCMLDDMGSDLRCFHNATRCGFCFPRGNHTARENRPPSKQAHCPGCGCFLARGWSICSRCMRARIVAPRLPLDAVA